MTGHSHLLAVQIQNHNPTTTAHNSVIGVCIMFAGIIAACYGLAPMVKFKLWRAQATSAAAQVVDNVPQRPDGPKPTWLPVVEFLLDGTPVRSQVEGPPRPSGWPLGAEVDVLYDPEKPSTIWLADTRFPISYAFIGGVSVIGIYLAVLT